MIVVLCFVGGIFGVGYMAGHWRRGAEKRPLTLAHFSEDRPGPDMRRVRTIDPKRFVEQDGIVWPQGMN